VARRSSIRRNLSRCFHPLEYVTDANAGIEVPSGQTPARGGEEIARRRVPAQQAATQPQQVAPPGMTVIGRRRRSPIRRKPAEDRRNPNIKQYYRQVHTYGPPHPYYPSKRAISRRSRRRRNITGCSPFSRY
jgi:hypothetical protein